MGMVGAIALAVAAAVSITTASLGLEQWRRPRVAVMVSMWLVCLAAIVFGRGDLMSCLSLAAVAALTMQRGTMGTVRVAVGCLAMAMGLLWLARAHSIVLMSECVMPTASGGECVSGAYASAMVRAGPPLLAAVTATALGMAAGLLIAVVLEARAWRVVCVTLVGLVPSLMDGLAENRQSLASLAVIALAVTLISSLRGEGRWASRRGSPASGMAPVPAPILGASVALAAAAGLVSMWRGLWALEPVTGTGPLLFGLALLGMAGRASWGTGRWTTWYASAVLVVSTFFLAGAGELGPPWMVVAR